MSVFSVHLGVVSWKKFLSNSCVGAQMSSKLRSATELLGEKEERVAELEADVADMRQLYQQQVVEFVEQLAQASLHSSPAPSPRPSM